MPLLRESYRVLRSGGRIVIIEGGRRGIAGLLRSRARLPRRRGHRHVAHDRRVPRRPPLAEREGYRFTEGLK